jgi:hypothetical protein
MLPVFLFEILLSSTQQPSHINPTPCAPIIEDTFFASVITGFSSQDEISPDVAVAVPISNENENNFTVAATDFIVAVPFPTDLGSNAAADIKHFEPSRADSLSSSPLTRSFAYPRDIQLLNDLTLNVRDIDVIDQITIKIESKTSLLRLLNFLHHIEYRLTTDTALSAIDINPLNVHINYTDPEFVNELLLSRLPIMRSPNLFFHREAPIIRVNIPQTPSDTLEFVFRSPHTDPTNDILFTFNDPESKKTIKNINNYMVTNDNRDFKGQIRQIYAASKRNIWWKPKITIG